MKFIKNLLIVVVTFFTIVNTALAGNIAHANVSKYEMTINKIEIYNSTTDEWITISSTAKTIDIAPADAGATIGSMVNDDVTLSFGSYTKVRATVSDTFIIKACSDSGGSTCTTADIQSGSSNSALVSTATSAASAEGSVTVNGGTAVTKTVTLTTPFEMTVATTSMSSSVSFNLDNVFTYTATGGGGYISPGEPVVTISLQ